MNASLHRDDDIGCNLCRVEIHRAGEIGEACKAAQPLLADQPRLGEQVGTRGEDLSDVTWSASGLPAGLTLSDTGQLSGTPSRHGSFPVTIEVAAEDRADAASVTLEVLFEIALDAPAALPDAIYGVAYTADISGWAEITTGAGATIAFSAANLPDGLSLSPEGILSGAPSEMGAFEIDFTASAEGIADSATVRLRAGLPAGTPREESADFAS